MSPATDLPQAFARWRFSLGQLLLLIAIFASILALAKIHVVWAIFGACILASAWRRYRRIAQRQGAMPFLDEMSIFGFGVIAILTLLLISVVGVALPMFATYILAGLVPNRTVAAMMLGVALPACAMTLLVVIRVVSGLAEHWEIWPTRSLEK